MQTSAITVDVAIALDREGVSLQRRDISKFLVLISPLATTPPTRSFPVNATGNGF